MCFFVALRCLLVLLVVVRLLAIDCGMLVVWLFSPFGYLLMRWLGCLVVILGVFYCLSLLVRCRVACGWVV